jgi:hypothetical protein
MSKTKTPEYEIDFQYSRRGAGIAIAFYGDGPDGPITFMQEGRSLLVAEGEPIASLDGGHYAEEWHNVTEWIYEDSQEDGTFEQFYEDERPGLLDEVRAVFKACKGTMIERTYLTEQPIKLPKPRSGESDVARVGALVRAWLGLDARVRYQDDSGHKVITHREAAPKVKRRVTVLYSGTVVYEGTRWTDAFCEWYEGRDDEPGPSVEVLSSYEIGVLR